MHLFKIHTKSRFGPTYSWPLLISWRSSVTVVPMMGNNCFLFVDLWIVNPREPAGVHVEIEKQWSPLFREDPSWLECVSSSAAVHFRPAAHEEEHLPTSDVTKMMSYGLCNSTWVVDRKSPYLSNQTLSLFSHSPLWLPDTQRYTKVKGQNCVVAVFEVLYDCCVFIFDMLFQGHRQGMKIQHVTYVQEKLENLAKA